MNSSSSQQASAIKGQPKTLYFLSLLELNERFSHYLLRAIIVLYMVKVLLFNNHHAYGVFAGFSSLLYLSPLFGGYVADRWLGANKAILYGSATLSAGYFLLALTEGEGCLYFSLALLILGSGLFMPNIVKLVGLLYQPNDARREAGFSIFYAAINIGALLSPLLASVITTYNWHTGFFIAGIGTTLTTMLQLTKRSTSDKSSFGWPLNMALLLLLPSTAWLLSALLRHPAFATTIVFITGFSFLFYVSKKSRQLIGSQQRAVSACLSLTLFSILFEALFQQSAMSMTLFIDTHVYRNIVGIEIPTVLSQALNPLFIVLLAPTLSITWLALDKVNLNPSVPMKFALGTLLAGISFAILPVIVDQAQSGQIHYGWIVLSYLLQSCGELLVSPIGLAMLTEKAPTQLTGLMIGVWYFSLAIGQALAGFVSQMTVTTSYSETFGAAGILAIFTGMLLFMLAPRFSKMLAH